MIYPIRIRVGRTNVIGVNFGGDISGSTWTSEIRKEKSIHSQLIATFEVEFNTDGTDGILILTLDDSDSAGIQHSTGWMDIKKVETGEPLSGFDEPLPVVFEGVVTA